jgi:hypothetical protein
LKIGKKTRAILEKAERTVARLNTNTNNAKGERDETVMVRDFA